MSVRLSIWFYIHMNSKIEMLLKIVYFFYELVSLCICFFSNTNTFFIFLVTRLTIRINSL